ncbi:MAG TPA: VOC family protein [Bacteroidota bacterium]
MQTYQNAINWFEIPANDIKRAKAFYETIFDMKLQELNINDDLKMALFPVEGDGTGGALVQHQAFYHPSHQGPLLYLNANPNLQAVLDRVPPNGGKVLIAKRQISPERGYMAVFEDSEGNRIALHSNG